MIQVPSGLSAATRPDAVEVPRVPRRKRDDLSQRVADLVHRAGHRHGLADPGRSLHNDAAAALSERINQAWVHHRSDERELRVAGGDEDLAHGDRSWPSHPAILAAAIRERHAISSTQDDAAGGLDQTTIMTVAKEIDGLL